MKNFGEKMRRKTFWSVLDWVERKENKWWDSGVFSLGLPKSFLPKMERKLKRKIGYHFLTKMPICSCTWACLRCSSLFFFFPPGCCLLFFFDLLSKLPTLVLILFFFFCFLLYFFVLDLIFFRHVFFIFLINLGD